MKPTRLENLQHAMRELEVSIARHKSDDPNRVLPELTFQRDLLKKEIDLLIKGEQKGAGIRDKEENHLHE
jgi:hypothetical protein